MIRVLPESCRACRRVWCSTPDAAVRFSECPFCGSALDARALQVLLGEARKDWRCECGDLNRWHEVFCYRCGAGPQEDV